MFLKTTKIFQIEVAAPQLHGESHNNSIYILLGISYEYINFIFYITTIILTHIFANCPFHLSIL